MLTARAQLAADRLALNHLLRAGNDDARGARIDGRSAALATGAVLRDRQVAHRVRTSMTGRRTGVSAGQLGAAGQSAFDRRLAAAGESIVGSMIALAPHIRAYVAAGFAAAAVTHGLAGVTAALAAHALAGLAARVRGSLPLGSLVRGPVHVAAPALVAQGARVHQRVLLATGTLAHPRFLLGFTKPAADAGQMERETTHFAAPDRIHRAQLSQTDDAQKMIVIVDRRVGGGHGVSVSVSEGHRGV